jgi:hypothetical protein
MMRFGRQSPTGTWDNARRRASRPDPVKCYVSAVDRFIPYVITILLGLVVVSYVAWHYEPCFRKGGLWEQITTAKECFRAVDEARRAR